MALVPQTPGCTKVSTGRGVQQRGRHYLEIDHIRREYVGSAHRDSGFSCVLSNAEEFRCRLSELDLEPEVKSEIVEPPTTRL